MWAFLGQLGKQVLLGVGMAAGNAIVETGQQVTINALQAKMAEWGVNVDSNSVLGIFSENLKSNLGFQTSFMIMNATDTILNSQLDVLAQASRANEKKIKETLSARVSAVKNSFGSTSGFGSSVRCFWRGVKTAASGNKTSLDSSVQSIAKDELDADLSQERSRLQAEGQRFLEHRKTTGAMFNGLAVGAGTINTSNNHGGFSDDTKLFDAVQMLMNMKKVG